MRKPKIKKRVLFILKKQEIYGDNRYSLKSSGLLNSATYVEHMVSKKLGLDTQLVQVVDANDIDREVTAFKPTHVVIEALWVTPAKFTELTALHPEVEWVVRLHSEIPFLASEGIAFGWIAQYLQIPNVFVSANSDRTYEDLVRLYRSSQLVYLPNYYPALPKMPSAPKQKGVIDVACFGAIRPLKNQLIQAVAAIEFAAQKRVKLRFHMNGNRVEQAGDSVRRNIISLFDSLPAHELVLHPWYDRTEYLNVLKDMDLSLQVSFTESFNIVSADSVSLDIPTIGSKEIRWLDPRYQADTTSVLDIVAKMKSAWLWRIVNRHHFNKANLAGMSSKAVAAWRRYLA